MDELGRPSNQAEAEVLVYEPNPKHKPIPTPGRHGSICPRDANGQSLLDASELVGRKRYATDGLRGLLRTATRREQVAWVSG